MANGTFAEHIMLEQELAAFFDRSHAIVFSTGYAATMGMAATLAGPGDVILLDADSHASIYDGVRLSGAEIIRFRHNDAADLEKRLRRLGDRPANTLIIVEGIYSMLGDRAPLADIAGGQAQDTAAMLLVDEAHSMGMLGEHGRGAGGTGRRGGRRRLHRRHLQQEPGCDRRLLREQSSGTGRDPLRHPLLYLHRLALALGHRLDPRGAAPPAAAPAAARAAVANARHLYDGLKALGFRVSPEVSPVVAVTVEDRGQAIQLVEPADGIRHLRQSGHAARLARRLQPAALQYECGAHAPSRSTGSSPPSPPCATAASARPMMDKLSITGNGPPDGEVRISGAKNAALPMLAATLLRPSRCASATCRICATSPPWWNCCRQLGARIEVPAAASWSTSDTRQIHSVRAPYELVKTMRASILVLGPLLARFGEAEVSLPGGCAIGSRPVNLHIQGLKAMGADIGIEDGYIKAHGQGPARAPGSSSTWSRSPGRKT